MNRYIDQYRGQIICSIICGLSLTACWVGWGVLLHQNGADTATKSLLGTILVINTIDWIGNITIFIGLVIALPFFLLYNILHRTCRVAGVPLERACCADAVVSLLFWNYYKTTAVLPIHSSICPRE